MGRYAVRSYTKFTVLHEHVAVAEEALGKKLPAGAVVHHVDGNPLNNEPSNLVICPNQGYHKLLHIRTDALNACGNANYRKCVLCKEYDDTTNMAIHSRKGNMAYVHVGCRRAKDNARYHRA